MTVRTFGVSPPDGRTFLTPPNLPWNPTRDISSQKHIFGAQFVQRQGGSRVGSSSCQDLARTGGAAVFEARVWSFRTRRQNKGLRLSLMFKVPVRYRQPIQNHTVKSVKLRLLLSAKVSVTERFGYRKCFV